eukprot:7257946-Pyramimonas_sp.AAC.1
MSVPKTGAIATSAPIPRSPRREDPSTRARDRINVSDARIRARLRRQWRVSCPRKVARKRPCFKCCVPRGRP